MKCMNTIPTFEDWYDYLTLDDLSPQRAKESFKIVTTQRTDDGTMTRLEAGIAKMGDWKLYADFCIKEIREIDSRNSCPSPMPVPTRSDISREGPSRKQGFNRKPKPQFTYSEMLKSPEWIVFRDEVLKRDEFTCQNCGQTEGEMNVHHKKYLPNRKPWQYAKWMVTTLCRACHETTHSI